MEGGGKGVPILIKQLNAACGACLDHHDIDAEVDRVREKEREGRRGGKGE